MSRILLLFGVCCITVGAARLDAQTPTQRADSLERELRRITARLDSLERLIARLTAQRQDTTAAADELSRLRAAAAAAASEGEQRDEAGQQQSRTRNLQILNPEISITGDVVGNYVKPGGEGHAFSGTPREFEFSFQAALDPFTRTKIFVTREEDFEIAGFPEEEGEEEEAGGFEIEEGYMYWVGLPGGFGAKIGKFRQEIGLYNRWHTHALLDVERPLAAITFLGEDGLIQTGAAVTFPAFTVGPATQTATFEVTRGDNEALFLDGGQISYLGRLQSFWNTSAGTYVQFGATGVWGQNDEEALTSKLLGLDFSFRWTPPGAALYRDLQFKSEWYFTEREIAGVDFTASGGYGQLNYKVARQWILGVRADYLDPIAGEPNVFQVAPNLTFWQSEWVRLRLQYNYLKPSGASGNHTVLFQAVWAVGPHKHETY